MTKPRLTQRPMHAISRLRSSLVRVLFASRIVFKTRSYGEVTELDQTPDVLVVGGWAGFDPDELLTVSVLVGAHTTASVEVSVDRAPQRTRWRTEIPLGDLSPGTNVIQVLLLMKHGILIHLPPRSFVTLGRASVGSFDWPSSESVITERVLWASGWFRTNLGFDRIELSINDKPIGRARILSHARADVEGLVGDADAPLAGWDLVLELPNDVENNVDIAVEAVGAHERLLIDKRKISVAGELGRPVADIQRAQVLKSRAAARAKTHAPAEKQIRVLVATHHLGLGGGQLYLQELLDQLLKTEEITCTVFSSQDGALRDELEQLGAEVQIVGETPTSYVDYEQWMYSLVGSALTTEANVVLANTAGSFWGVELASRLGIASIWAVHESFTPEIFARVGFTSPPDDGVRQQFLDSFSKAAAVVFEADETMNLYAPLIRDGRALRIDYGINLSEIGEFRADEQQKLALRKQLGIGKDDVVILCVGTYESRKAQGVLSMALSRVTEDFPDAVLALVGDGPGWFSEALHRVVERLDVADRIQLIPATKKIHRWYAVADAFILASDIESMPRSMMEAMAHGVPILGPAVFGVPTLVQDGVNGFLFEPNSVLDAEFALRRFLSLSTSERRQMGHSGRELVFATRSSELYAHQFRSLMRGYLADTDALPGSLLGV